ncbi:MAG: hypothetical protein WBZ42_08930 [Halobacteriota archaeon]
MMISVFGTVSVTAQSSTHSTLPTTYTVRQASFSGHYTGNEVVKTADIFAVTRTRGTYSGSATLKSDGKTISGTGSGTGQGQFFGSQQGSYFADITSTFDCTLVGKSVHGTYKADITIDGAVTHVEGPLQGTFDGSTMNVHWSSHVMQKDDGSITVTHFNGFIEFLVAQ